MYKNFYMQVSLLKLGEISQLEGNGETGEKCLLACKLTAGKTWGGGLHVCV